MERAHQRSGLSETTLANLRTAIPVAGAVASPCSARFKIEPANSNCFCADEVETPSVLFVPAPSGDMRRIAHGIPSSLFFPAVSEFTTPLLNTLLKEESDSKNCSVDKLRVSRCKVMCVRDVTSFSANLGHILVRNNALYSRVGMI